LAVHRVGAPGSDRLRAQHQAPINAFTKQIAFELGIASYHGRHHEALGRFDFDHHTAHSHKVGEAVGDLMLRREAMTATRVCGGACTLPGQLGEWCDHAHDCLTCRFFRADGDDIEHFRCEQSGLYVAIETLEQEARSYEQNGQTRLAEITRKRLQRNKDAVHNTTTIISSIEERGLYKGTKPRYRPAATREETSP
jgi:hypothetical protein